MKIVDNGHGCGCESCEISCCRRYCCKCQKPGKSILNCGCGGVGPLSVISAPLNSPIPVASTSIDTRCMECPRVLLHFTAQINLPEGATATLNFIISRTDKCGCPQNIGGTFTFTTTTTALASESFSFQYCDCNPSPDCTTYTVELDPAEVTVAGVTITNATISALAVENLF